MSLHRFDNINPDKVNIHDGDGDALFHHMIKEGEGTHSNFVGLIELPVGSSIGLHRHGSQDEEIYIIISGQGEMQEEDRTFEVTAGDVIINPPGFQHSLKNISSEPLKFVAVDIATKS